MAPWLSEEVALRIGLAAKALKTVDTRELIDLIISITGKPITLSRLDKLRAKRMRGEGQILFKEVLAQDFENAFALLKGRGVQQYLHPSPEIPTGTFCDIRGALTVACASNSGEHLDGAFVNCQRFLIYQVSADHIRLIDIREPSKKPSKSDKLLIRTGLVSDCAILYANTISARAAAKIVKAGIHPIIHAEQSDTHSILVKLQERLKQDILPPWIVKAMSSFPASSAKSKDTAVSETEDFAEQD